MDDKEQSEFHNEIAHSTLKAIVRGTKNDFASSLVIIESVVFGILLYYEKTQGIPRAVALDRLYEGIQGRLNDA